MHGPIFFTRTSPLPDCSNIIMFPSTALLNNYETSKTVGMSVGPYLVNWNYRSTSSGVRVPSAEIKGGVQKKRTSSWIPVNTFSLTWMYTRIEWGRGFQERWSEMSRPPSDPPNECCSPKNESSNKNYEWISARSNENETFKGYLRHLKLTGYYIPPLTKSDWATIEGSQNWDYRKGCTLYAKVLKSNKIEVRCKFKYLWTEHSCLM